MTPSLTETSPWNAGLAGPVDDASVGDDQIVHRAPSSFPRLSSVLRPGWARTQWDTARRGTLDRRRTPVSLRPLRGVYNVEDLRRRAPAAIAQGGVRHHRLGGRVPAGHRRRPPAPAGGDDVRRGVGATRPPDRAHPAAAVAARPGLRHRRLRPPGGRPRAGLARRGRAGHRHLAGVLAARARGHDPRAVQRPGAGLGRRRRRGPGPLPAVRVADVVEPRLRPASGAG